MRATEALCAPSRVVTLGTALLDLAAVGATIGQVAALAAILDPVLLHAQGIRDVAAPAAVLIALTLVRAALLAAREIRGQHAAVRVKSHLRVSLLERLVRLGPSALRDERAGELVTLLGDGVERLDVYVSRYLPQKILAVTAPLAVAAYLCWIDPLSAGVLLISAPIIPLLMVAVGSYAEEQVRSQWTELRRMSAYILDVLQGLPTLKLLWRADDEGRHLAAISTAFRTRTLAALRYGFLSSFVLEFMTTGAIALVAVELGLRLLDGAIGFAATLQVLLLAPEFYRPLRELGAQRHAALEATAAAERIQSVLELPLHVGNEHRRPPPPTQPKAPTALEFHRVSYAYPDAREPAVRNLSFTLTPGSRTALVGPTGAGKSTLASLVVRFLEPTDGVILANGVPITSLSVEDWRERVALVPQRPYLFEASALDNLRLARPAASLEEVIVATSLAGAHDFLKDLPDGYHTRLGERGARLSRGQAQRLAIARAFLTLAPLLVLDEPTSALDAESERHVRAAVEHLTAISTVLLIAHRLSTVTTADHVMVMDAGQVVERGTHRDLVTSGGLYAQLVDAGSELLAAA
jgi:ATP-binding cassette, subfamily C, bacterial CydD